MIRATMTTRVTIGTAAGGVRHVLVSLPRVDCLVAELPQKYFEPGDAPAPTRSDVSARTWSRFQRRDKRKPRSRQLVEPV